MNIKAALLAVLTLGALVAVYAVASFELAYPEGGPVGWFLVGAIVAVWAIMFGLIVRIGKER